MSKRPTLMKQRTDVVSLIKERIQEGNTLLNEAIKSKADLQQETAKYNKWNKYNEELLRTILSDDTLAEEYSMFVGVATGVWVTLEQEILAYRREILDKIDSLDSIKNRISLFQEDPSLQYISNEEVKTNMEQSNNIINKIFISHSSQDKEYAECLVRLLTDIGVPHEKIFCSSVKGYGIPGGVNFLEYIRKTLDSNVVVVSLLTDRFYNSKVSLCEMGATWVKTNMQIPIVIPPFTYDDIDGVIKGIQGFTIDDKEDINELRNQIENLFNLKPVNTNIWEKRRDDYLAKINIIQQQETQTSEYNAEELDEDKLMKFIFYALKNSDKKLMTTIDIFEELKREYGIHKQGYELYDIYNLLEQLDYSGKVKKLDFDGTTLETMMWRSIL